MNQSLIPSSCPPESDQPAFVQNTARILVLMQIKIQGGGLWGSDSVSISPIHAKEHSPPRRGGVDATSIKCCEASLFKERTGWSDRRKGFPGLTTFTASRYRARASRPSARAKGRFAAS